MPDTSNPKRIIIVGGVAGGMSAAARARRLNESAQITVLERGGYVSFANCGLPYYLGREITDKGALVLQTPASLKARFNLDVRLHNEVLNIDTEKKTVEVRDILKGKTYTEEYDELVLSVGAAPIRPPLPGIELPGLFTLRNIEDIDLLESWIEGRRPANAVIVGGGLIGLEVAEQLVRRGMSVTVVEGQNQVLPPADQEIAELAHRELRRNGVKLILNSFIKEFKAPAGLATSGSQPGACWVIAGENDPIPADLVILGLGVRPEVTLARKAGLPVGQRGGLVVDEALHSSADHIWAIGDAIEVVQPLNKQHTLAALGGPANRQGRLVADNILGQKRTYGGTIGTAIVRVFDLAIAMTGLNERQLKAEKVPYEVVYLHPLHHAGYYPGAERLDMKVLFHKETGKILGAQIAGKQGVDKRIDVLSTAIKGHMTVRDLAELELSYAPPFGSAKDPINVAGMIASNILDGAMQQAQWHEIPALTSNGHCLIDVRSAGERERGFIPNSIHIPLPELRGRLSEIPQGKTLIVYCQSGQRSYYATRILNQSGFKAKNFSGGYLTWQSATQQPDSAGGGSQTPASCCGAGEPVATKKQISAQELQTMRKSNGNLKLIDVRSPAEFASENIDGSVNIPLADLPRRMNEIPKEATIVLICRSGMRASQAASILSSAGYNETVLTGGIVAWRGAGLPVNKGRACLPLERQVQLVVGLTIITSVLLGAGTSKLFLVLTGFLGCGLTFAALTGNCALAMVLSKAPWNTALPSSLPATNSGSCCQ